VERRKKRGLDEKSKKNEVMERMFPKQRAARKEENSSNRKVKRMNDFAMMC